MAGSQILTQKYYSRGDRNVTINAASGHFVTGSSHVNYFVDISRLNMRVKESMGAARALRNMLINNVTEIDTIVCLSGMQMLGGFLGQEMESGGFTTKNSHKTMYVVEPQENSLHEYMFANSARMAIGGKNCLILEGALNTGDTAKRLAECIEYYGGSAVGVAAVFSTVKEIDGLSVYSVFDTEDLPGYGSYSREDCPFCKKGLKPDALVNSSGYAVQIM